MSNKFDNFKIADMDDNATKALKEKESKLNMETGKDFVLIAYEKK